MKKFIVPGDINSSYKILMQHSIHFTLLTVARSLAILTEGITLFPMENG